MAGFSVYLEGLAKHISAGVWLKSIELTQGGKSIVLTGKTIQTANALQFLRNLTNSKEFVNRKFELSELSASAKSKQPLSFILRTQELNLQ